MCYVKTCGYHFKYRLQRIQCVWRLLSNIYATYLRIFIKQQYGQLSEYLKNHEK